MNFLNSIIKGGPPSRFEADFRPGPPSFLSFFSFFRFYKWSQTGILRIPWFPAGGLPFFVFFVFIRFYSFLPFDAIWPARQGRLPCLAREGCRRHFAFDLHIEIIQIRPFGLEFCLRPAGTLSFFVFSFFRFYSFLLPVAFWCLCSR